MNQRSRDFVNAIVQLAVEIDYDRQHSKAKDFLGTVGTEKAQRQQAQAAETAIESKMTRLEMLARQLAEEGQ